MNTFFSFSGLTDEPFFHPFHPRCRKQTLGEMGDAESSDPFFSPSGSGSGAKID